MSSPLLVRSALALALFMAADVHAATDADLAEIRDQIRQLKESYEARIQALEQRLKAAEAKADAVPAAVAAAAVAAPAVATAPAAFAAAGVRPQRRPASARSTRPFPPCCRVPTPTCRRTRSLRDRGLRAKRRHRSRRSASSQHRGVRIEPVRQRRRQVLRQPDLFAVAGQHRRSRGSVRPVHRGTVRYRAEVRPLPVVASATSTTSISMRGTSTTRRSSIRRSWAVSTRTTDCR